MNWKKPVFMLGAVLLCTSLLMANTPPAQVTAAGQQVKPVAPAKAGPAQLTALDVAPQRQLKPMPAQHTTGAAAPQNLVRGITCPEDSLFGQDPHGPDDAWSFGTSAISTSFDYLIQENYSGATGEICDIHWWGLSLYYSAGWSACDPTGMTFNVVFYADDGGAPGAAVCTYTDVLPTITSTGIFYAGLYEMWYWEIPSLDPCCNLIDGWVSIQSQMNDNDCAFLWASSPDGDGQSLQNGAPYLYDDAFCLTGEYMPQYGACCDDYTGVCEDDVEYLDCDGRFAADTLCADLDPPCGEIPGACCCPDGTCEITVEMDCELPCFWLGEYTTCDQCPPAGACCVYNPDTEEFDCVATTFEFECEGAWYEGETCPEFECPPTAADWLVEAPYTSPVRTTCDAGYDCDLVPDSPDHEYEVVIPYAATWNFNTCLYQGLDTEIYVGTTLCGQEIGYNDDSCGVQSEVIAYLEPGNYFCTIEHYCCDTCGEYIFNVRDVDLGACCVYNGETQCYDVHESECDEMGGVFYLGETCDNFTCPEPCEESQIDIVILTDPYPSETTWEVTDHATGEVLCSGGPYSGSNTYYFEMCCIGYEDCADFTIYDSYGDGIYAPGGYTVSVDGELICDAMGGGFTGSVQTCPMLGGGCVWPLGACCVSGECIGTMIEPECELGAWPDAWYEGEDCATFECPGGPCDDAIYNNGSDDLVNGLACDRRIAAGGLEAWVVDDVFLMADTNVTDLHWQCATGATYAFGDTADILIMADDGGTPGTVMYELFDVAASRSYMGYEVYGRPVYTYTIEGIDLFLPAGNYWFGMRPVNQSDLDQNFWETCPDNGTSDVYFRSTYFGYPNWVTGATVFGVEYNVAFCITGYFGEPPVGSCCDDYTGICEDDVELPDCMPPLRFTADTLCADLDPPCGPTGACCDADLVCLFTDVQAECDAVGGSWYEGEDCDAGFECPAYCEHSIELWDDYGDGWNGGMLDVFVNGNLVLDNITLPSGYGPATFIFLAATGDTITTVYTASGWPYENYYYIYDINGIVLCADGEGGVDPTGCTCTGNCGPPPRGACCDDYNGICEDDVAITDCDGRFAMDTLCCDLDPPCGILGACCDLDLNCVATNTEYDCDVLGGNWVEGEDCFGTPPYECLAHCYDCPSNGMLEGEPVCEDDYVDNYNGGCNSSPYVFQDILCDEVICGESGTFLMGGSSYRDTDWFRVEVAEATTLGWSVCAEFDVLIFIIDAGTENCVDYTILGNVTAPPEVPATLSFDVGPGVYWLWAGPSVFSGIPCGSQYTGIVTGVAPCICGDFDNDDDVDVDDFYFFLDAFGSCEGDEKYEEACDFDGDLCITLVDFQMWMDCYRDANGKAFVAPLQRTNSRPAGQKAPKGAQPR